MTLLVSLAVCPRAFAAPHDIKVHTDPTSPVHKSNLAQQVCADCHSSVRLTRKYGLSSEIFRTFSDSYHGLAVRGGCYAEFICVPEAAVFPLPMNVAAIDAARVLPGSDN